VGEHQGISGERFGWLLHGAKSFTSEPLGKRKIKVAHYLLAFRFDKIGLLGHGSPVLDWPSALLLWPLYSLLLCQFMKLRFEIDQAESFRRGIDRPKSIVSIEVNPADIPEESRSVIADHLAGIDVLKFFYHDGDVIKGYPIKELSYTSQEPKRIVAKGASLEALISAIRANDEFISGVQKSFDRPIQFQLIEQPPKNETEFSFISSQRPDQLEQIRQAIQQKERIWFECFLENIQKDLNSLLHAHSYRVFLLPLLPLTAQARFYCEPFFAARFLDREVVAHSRIIVYNEKTGRIAEAKTLFHALDIYMVSGVTRGTILDDLSILRWQGGHWGIVAPEGLIDMKNDALEKAKLAAEEPKG
jgi:hypothetical protein